MKIYLYNLILLLVTFIDYILVHAAAGGVGLLLCQLSKYLGATVIGTVSSAEKAALARENGADYVINYTEEDVVAKVNEITNGLGCHGIFDGVGKSTWDISLQSARRLGSVISFGNASGVVPPVSSFLSLLIFPFFFLNYDLLNTIPL